MKLKILLIPIMILLFPLIVNAFSGECGDFRFCEIGDEQLNGSWRRAPAVNEYMTTSRWSGAVTWKYVDDNPKLGNMTIHSENNAVERAPTFKFSGEGLLSNITAQVTCNTDGSDTTGFWYFALYAGGVDMATIGFNSVVDSTNYNFYTSDQANAGGTVDMPDEWVNLTVEVAPNADYIAIFINGSLQVNDSTATGVDTIRMYYGGDTNAMDVRCDNMFVWNGSWKDMPQAPVATYTNNKRNITTPRQNDHVGFNITITSPTLLISGYIFAYDNGTGDQFYNSSFQRLTGTELIANATFNITIYNESGVTWRWRWFANDTTGAWTKSEIFSLTVAGVVAPALTINPTNFFTTANTSSINLDNSKIAFFNFTLTDSIQNFGYELNVTPSDDVTTVCFNQTNNTLTGSIDNITFTANLTSLGGVCAARGNYTVSITAWDSHTANAIKDYEIIKARNYLVFDEITITADNANFFANNTISVSSENSILYL